MKLWPHETWPGLYLCLCCFNHFLKIHLILCGSTKLSPSTQLVTRDKVQHTCMDRWRRAELLQVKCCHVVFTFYTRCSHEELAHSGPGLCGDTHTWIITLLRRLASTWSAVTAATEAASSPTLTVHAGEGERLRPELLLHSDLQVELDVIHVGQ